MNTLNTIGTLLANINREALTVAYEALGASPHQLPRNCMSMRLLVLNTVSAGEANGLTVKEIAAKLRGQGFRINLQSLRVTVCNMRSQGALQAKGARGRGVQSRFWL